MSDLSPDVLRRQTTRLRPQAAPETAGHSRATGRYLMALVVLFAVLNAADLLSTYVGLRHGLHEGNPLMNGLLERFGFGALIAYKVVVIWAVAAGVRLLQSFRYSVARATIWTCNVLVFGVVLLNVVQYLALA